LSNRFPRKWGKINILPAAQNIFYGWIPAFAGMTKKPGGHSMNKQPCVYLLASKRNGTLYVGVTSDLIKRVWEHKNHVADGFTKRYGVDRLVWYEVHETMESAIGREKALKEWQRAWKLELIEKFNPDWKDLYDSVC
jgi:putative endonuclease